MKLTKSLFMLCAAGLSLCACNSDDIKNQLPEGRGAVEVKIVPPTTRASVGSTAGNTDGQVVVEGDVYVTLTASKGGGTIKISKDDFQNETTVKFWNVEEPTKVEVSMNGGVSSYNAISIVEEAQQTTYNVGLDGGDKTEEKITIDMQALPTAIPVYGVATATDGGGLDKTNSVETHEGKSYQMWKAKIKPEIPVARLEVSVKRESASTLFSKLNVSGVYLDHIMPMNGSDYKTYYSSKDAAYDAVNNPNGTATGVSAAILEDAFDAPISFVSAGSRIPSNSEQVFAYNFYGSTQVANVPQFKIYFTGAESVTQGTSIPESQYAIIKSYKLSADGPDIALENGKIYKVIDIVLPDEKVQSDESGTDIAYAVSVVVEEATWTIQEVNGVWD